MNLGAITGFQPNFMAKVHYADGIMKAEPSTHKAIQAFADSNGQDAFVYNINEYTGEYQVFSGDTFRLSKTNFDPAEKTYTERALVTLEPPTRENRY